MANYSRKCYSYNGADDTFLVVVQSFLRWQHGQPTLENYAQKTKIFEFLSLHMIYVINIMTNQGSSLIYFHSFHYRTALGII